jgi:hypothetical protein
MVALNDYIIGPTPLELAHLQRWMRRSRMIDHAKVAALRDVRTV